MVKFQKAKSHNWVEADQVILLSYHSHIPLVIFLISFLLISVSRPSETSVQQRRKLDPRGGGTITIL